MTETAQAIEVNSVTHRFLAERVRADFDRFLEYDSWTEAMVKNVITYYFADPEAGAMAWKKAMEFLETEPVAEVVEGDEDNEGPIYELGLNDPAFRGYFEETAREQFKLKMDTLDPLSNLASMSPFSQSHASYDYFEDRSAKFYLRPFLASGGFGYVTGNPGAGKTNFTVLLMELAIEMGIAVATNIKMEDPEIADRVHMTRSFKDLLKFSLDNLKKGKFTIAFLDEVAQFFSRKKAMTKEYVNMEKMLFLLRKVGCNLVAIVQRPEDVASVIVSFSTVHYQKTKKREMVMKLDDRVYEIHGVPASHLAYNTWDTASFQIDLNVDALHARIASMPPDADQFQAITDFLSEEEGREVTKAEKMTACKVLYTAAPNIYTRARWTYKELGRLFGVSHVTIRNWLIDMGAVEKKDWRDELI